ncbi:MAG: NUMOD4 motif-containing HNH endonuclease [Sulfuricellaceae bacterium]
MTTAAKLAHWVDVYGYVGLYQVSDTGLVRSVQRNIILKQHPHTHGYSQVSIYKDGKAKTHSVHRLMMKSFTPEHEWKKQVNHKDGIKTNNTLSNLEWATEQENMGHAFRNGLMRSKHMPFEKVFIIREHLKAGKSLKETARLVGVGRSAVKDIRNGVTFKYV